MNNGNDMLIATGGEIKALGDDGLVAGFGVFFTDEKRPDLDNEFFTRETDYDLEDKRALGVYFAHGLDDVMKKRKLARGSVKQTDEGVWIQAQLDLRDRWLKRIFELIKLGKLSFSSGAIAHLVEKVKKGSATWIKTWPLIEVSFTPAPAAPFGTEVIALKSYDAPSLKETIRRSKLTEGELLREESQRLREHAQVMRDRINGTLSPDDWAKRQMERAAWGREVHAARQDWIKMRAQAKAQLVALDALREEMETKYDKVIAEQARINNSLRPRHATGAMPKWANRGWSF